MPSDSPIDLPDLNAGGAAHVEIVAENIRALQPVYFSAMLEELKVFQVVDKLIELFQSGALSISSGEARDNIVRYSQEAAKRVSATERRSFYARTLGLAGGEDGGTPNREFNDLWLRFVSAVSSFVRQSNEDDLAKAKIPGTISQQQVAKAGRDLAANLSLHGGGAASFVALELNKQIDDTIKILSDPEIRNSYGARDMWQVVDKVAALELGGAKNSSRYRTLASSGAIIFRWLATNASKLSYTSSDPILNLEEIRSPPTKCAGADVSNEPTDFALVNSCEEWLAASVAVEESSV